MRKRITFVNGHSVANAIARVHDNACCAAGCVEGEHSLDGNIHGWGVEGLEHDLCHTFTVGLWVQRCFSQENWVLLWRDTKLVVESMVPDLLHVVPVGHNAVLDGILQ